jgi:hypothetical protein
MKLTFRGYAHGMICEVVTVPNSQSGYRRQLSSKLRSQVMKTSKIVIGLATMLCVAVLAAHPAKAQFGIPPGGCDKATGACRLNIPPGQPGPRAINISPTGRPYDTQAPTYYRVPKTKAKR